MNWETAKTWLISMFLILDISLGWQLMQSRKEMLGYQESYTDLLANTKTVLADHGLMLAAAVPNTAPDMQSFRAVFAGPALADLAAAAFPKSPIVTADATGGIIMTAMGRLKMVDIGVWQAIYNMPIQVANPAAVLPLLWHGSAYAYDSAISTTQSPVYTEKYDGYPIFDVQATADIESGNLDGYVQTEIEQIATVGNAKPIISALNALNSLANSVDKSSQYPDNKILKIDLGYARKLSVGSIDATTPTSNYWFPVWRVSTSAQVYFINALTGEVDTSP